MLPGGGGGDAAAWGAGDHACADEERLADFFDGRGLLPDGDREGRNTNGPTAEASDQRSEDGAVEAVQAEDIHVVDL